ncbi:MAG: phage terminase small subunit [Silvimonas sp.]|nr:phage terminase small subunit [Silvimonas sp.]
MLKLAEDKRSLKTFQSVRDKIELKRKLLPAYEAWVDGVILGAGGAQDDVFMTVLVWRIDVGDYIGALAMARYAVAHDLRLPDQYGRSLPTLLAEEFADTTLQALKADGECDLAALDAVADLTADKDMFDEVRAKLFKARGLVSAANAAALPVDDPQRAPGYALALDHLRQALVFNDRVGVKKDIERIERETKTTESPPGTGDH